MPIPLGIFATAGAGGAAASDFELIQTVYGTGSSGSLSFDSIPQTYKHLEIRAVSRIVSGGGDTINVNGMRINGAGGGFDYQIATMFADQNGFVTNNPFDSSYVPFWSTNGGGDTNRHGFAIIQIPHYTATKKKNVSIMFSNGTESRTGMIAGSQFNTTGATTSIQIFSASGGNFTTTSRFGLYGLK